MLILSCIVHFRGDKSTALRVARRALCNFPVIFVDLPEVFYEVTIRSGMVFIQTNAVVQLTWTQQPNLMMECCFLYAASDRGTVILLLKVIGEVTQAAVPDSVLSVQITREAITHADDVITVVRNAPQAELNSTARMTISQLNSINLIIKANRKHQIMASGEFSLC
ncbi:hypothetical protein AHF37_03155 [Paragonimus kellicotti]|nr:hypothetical protein AHF37_03155 [Paragonimus kellicotti]